jgi:hypothetical protein
MQKAGRWPAFFVACSQAVWLLAAILETPCVVRFVRDQFMRHAHNANSMIPSDDATGILPAVP